MSQLENILEQSSELYLKYGLRSVSMDDIARSLSISKKTLYQHISSKQSLVSLIADYLLSAFSMHLTYLIEQQELDDKDHLSYVGTYILTFSQENYRFLFDFKKYYRQLWFDFDQKQRSIISKVIDPVYHRSSTKQLLKKSVDKNLFDFIFLDACRLEGHCHHQENISKYGNKVIAMLIDGLFNKSEN